MSQVGYSNTTDNFVSVENWTERAGLILGFGLTVIFALLANLAVIFVELLGSETSAPLRIYRLSMALSDLVLGILCFPFTFTNLMLNRWVFDEWLCKGTRFTQSMGDLASTLTLAALAFERFVVIWFPMAPFGQWLKRHTKLTVLVMWTVAASYAIWPALKIHVTSIQNKFNNKTIVKCSLEDNKELVFITFNFIFTFAVEWLLLLAAYSAILVKLLVIRNRLNVRAFGATTPKLTAIVVMFLIVVADGVCWAPNKIYHLLIAYRKIEIHTREDGIHHLWIKLGLYWPIVFNSAINPILYCLFSETFRNDLKQIWPRSQMVLERVWSWLRNTLEKFWS